MSRVLTPLDLRYVDGDSWLLLTDFRAISDTVGLIDVGAGFPTDFNSVPRALTNILPRDAYGEAAVLHDKLYRDASTGLRAVTRAEADQVHLEFLRWKGASWLRAHLMWAGIRVGGWKAWNAYRATPAQVQP